MSNQQGPEPCQHLSLARSEIGSISVCRECGVVQLHLQALSLRLEEGAFQTLAQMVLRASQRLAFMEQLSAEPAHAEATDRRAGLH